MHVGNNDDSSTCYIDGSELTDVHTRVSFQKVYGLWISADMKCTKQCMYAFNKATKVLGMIKRTKGFRDTRVILSLYKTLVRPHVEYCISA